MEKKVESSTLGNQIDIKLLCLVLEYLKITDGNRVNYEEVISMFNVDIAEVEEILDTLHNMGCIEFNFLEETFKIKGN